MAFEHAVKINECFDRLVRRSLSALTVLTLVIAGLAAQSAPRPNIVLIVSDDQGYGDAGVYGATDVETPTMDTVARDGVRFTAFRVNPLCAPTRASILSGLYSLETGMWRGPSNPNVKAAGRPRKIKPEVRLLPEYLQEAGYATGIFGKWHLGYEEPNTPNVRGFDEFVGFLSGAHPYHETKQSPFLKNGEPIRTSKHATDLFADAALDFIRENSDRPFFCYVPFNAVHGPLWTEDRPRTSGKPEYLEKYKAKGVDLPRRDYAAVLDHMDHRVGEIRRTLRALEIERDTLFIYLSDNGALTDKYPGDNGVLRGQKGSGYEGGIRVPAVMEWPGRIPGGRVVDVQAVHFDLFATILEAAGIETPARNGGYDVHGRSLLPYLTAEHGAAWPERLLFWDLFGKVAAVRGRWKIAGDVGNHRGNFARGADAVRKEKLELFDLEADLSESEDLALEHPAIYEELREKLASWLDSLN